MKNPDLGLHDKINKMTGFSTVSPNLVNNTLHSDILINKGEYNLISLNSIVFVKK